MKDTPFKNLAGSILLAKPTLLDPNFFQSMVFVARHDEHEALGFILNRPTGLMLSECIEPAERKPWHERIPVLGGGPVARESMNLVSFRAAPRRKKITARYDLSEAELIADLSKPNVWVRAFHGYAGWAGGQLERELREDSWVVHPADPVYFDQRVAGGLWPFLINGDHRWRDLLDYFPPSAASN